MVQIDRSVEAALAGLSPGGIDVHLFDATGPGSGQRLTTHASRLGLDWGDRASGPGRLDSQALSTGLHVAETLEVGGRRWEVICVPTAGVSRWGHTWGSWACLAALLLATASLSAHLLGSRARQVRTEQLAARFSAMISGMAEGIVFADATGVVVEVNDHFCRAVSKTRGDLVGQRITDVHTPAMSDRIAEHVNRFRRQPHSPPLVMQRAMGSAEVIMRVQPIYRGEVYDGVLLNVIDVTELVGARRQAEADPMPSS